MGIATAIGAGIAGVGSIVGASASNKASKRAAQTSADNNATNTALAREIYGKNQQALSPFMNRGNAAGNQINALLGLGGSQPAQQYQTTQAQPNALSQFQGGYYQGAPYSQGDFAEAQRFTGAGLPYGLGDSFIQPGAQFSQQQNPLAAQTGVTQGQTPQQAAGDAFDVFRNSTGYQFRLGEGVDALNSTYSGIGAVQSGARDRAAMEYGQNFASNEFGNYMNALGGQQAIGAGSASALAGVGQNFAGTVIGSNNQNAANQMNAQLSRQSGLANAAGILGGAAFQYGLGKL